jgi:hypothetical protein
MGSQTYFSHVPVPENGTNRQGTVVSEAATSPSPQMITSTAYESISPLLRLPQTPLAPTPVTCNTHYPIARSYCRDSFNSFTYFSFVSPPAHTDKAAPPALTPRPTPRRHGLHSRHCISRFDVRQQRMTIYSRHIRQLVCRHILGRLASYTSHGDCESSLYLLKIFGLQFWVENDCMK